MSLIKAVRAIQLNKSHPLARGLSGCWLFNEGTGAQTTDISGNGLNIPVVGGTPEWASGNHGSALYFNNGESEYMELDTAPVTNIPCTMLAWICPGDVTQGNHYYPLYIANKDVTNQAWGMLLNYGNDGEVSLITNISIYGRAVSSKCITAGHWHQVVCVIAGTTDRRCFVDGGNKGTSSITENTPSGLNRISIGRAGDSTPGYYFPGKIGCVFIWNRALTDTEIALLYRKPYTMFEAESRIKSFSFPIAINPLSGSINAQSLITGKIITNNKTDKLEKTWLMDISSNGMTGNAVKLGTVLSMGWFWMRNNGCDALYRGMNIEQIDFKNILRIVEPDTESILPPVFCEHENDMSYFYIVRHFNKIGIVEQTIRATVKVSLDSNGNIKVNRPNAIFTLNAKILEDSIVRLEWFYCPLEQKSIPNCFRIYFDNGSGQVDYENSIAEVHYTNRNVYHFVSQSLDTKAYLFAIKAENLDGFESISATQIKVQMPNNNPLSIEILNVTNV